MHAGQSKKCDPDARPVKNRAMVEDGPHRKEPAERKFELLALLIKRIKMPDQNEKLKVVYSRTLRGENPMTKGNGREEKLLPCPFCGGEATVRQSHFSYSFLVKCNSCEIVTKESYEMNKVIKLWNTRPPVQKALSIEEIHRILLICWMPGIRLRKKVANAIHQALTGEGK